MLCGIVIGIMLIPQGMAYGLLAGLPPIFGLYTSMWTLVAYMMTGTCRYLGPGVNAPISLLVENAVDTALGNTYGCGDVVAGMRGPVVYGGDGTLPADAAIQDCQEFSQASLLICLMVGSIYIGLWFLNAGFVTALMPQSALDGFTTGASAIIVTSNMKFFLGLTNLTRGQYGGSSLIYTWVGIFWNLFEINPTSLIIGLISLFLLDRIKWFNGKYKKRMWMPIPEQLVVLVISTTVVGTVRMDQSPYGVDVVGDVPSGLYVPSAPSLDNIGVLIPPSITIALVTSILTINVAKAVTPECSANQELLSLAAQSIVGGFTGACVPSGSFSRTALIREMDAETQLHNLVSCILVGIVIQWLTGPLRMLPKSVLASIIFMALKNMVKLVPFTGRRGVRDVDDPTKWKVEPIPSMYRVSKVRCAVKCLNEALLLRKWLSTSYVNH